MVDFQYDKKVYKSLPTLERAIKRHKATRKRQRKKKIKRTVKRAKKFLSQYKGGFKF